MIFIRYSVKNRYGNSVNGSLLFVKSIVSPGSKNTLTAIGESKISVVPDLTAVYFLTGPITTKLNIRVKDEKARALVFFIGNVIIIWTVKRLATITGVGISSIFFVLAVAAIITLVEKYVDEYSQKTLGKK